MQNTYKNKRVANHFNERLEFGSKPVHSRYLPQAETLIHFIARNLCENGFFVVTKILGWLPKENKRLYS